jgi:hypothetical protein
MNRKLLCLLMLVAVALPVYSQTGNGAPSGAHYSLNIIGVDKNKTAPLTGSDRHTIFVALTNSGDSHSNIYLTQGDFQVCDGNAFDAAYDCSGQKIQNQGAVFQLPCNTNITSTSGETIIPCSGGDTAAYTVWARALGQPGGSATITTCAFDPTLGEEVCSTENVVLVRNSGKSTFKNVTNELTSIYADIDGDGTLERVALFSGGLEDFVWQYDNNGLRLAQLRFYLQ